MTCSILLIFKLWMAAIHPLHVSVTEVVYDQNEKQLEITMRVFADDLEQALRKETGEPGLDLLDADKSRLDLLMDAYLRKRFSVVLDKRKQETRYLGHELEGDAFVFYIEAAKVKKWREISIANNVLMSVFSDQSNLVHVTVGEEVKSLRLTESNSSGVLSF